MGQPKIIGILAREGLKATEDLALKIIDRLHSLGFTAVTISPLKHRSAEFVKSVIELKHKRVDILLTVGGDGTIIKAMRDLDDETPVLGVAAGGRGVMAEVRPDEAHKALEKLRKGEYILDRRTRLTTIIDSKKLPPALNEVLFIRRGYTVTPTYTVSIRKRVKLSQRMDGLMISTPTGSTGHSYTLGGPVITESLDVFLLTPICPITRLPPLILPTLPVEVISNQPTIIVVDGQEVYQAEGGTSIKVAKHQRDAVFIRFSQKSLRQLANLGFG